MNKTKLAICIEDEEYKTRFVKCIMKHYKDSYEIHVMHCLKELEEEQKNKFDVIITGDGKDICQDILQNYAVLILKEHVSEKEVSLKEKIIYVEKYQEVYKIMQELEKVVTQNSFQKTSVIGEKETQIIGVFSLEKESMQMPFTALLAEILGETNSVLVIDIQPYSGFALEIDVESDALGMEDMMSIAATESYTNNRLSASIGCEPKWDFIYPVKNMECLTEANGELYQKMICILQKERSYSHIIINFGAAFSGMTEFMEYCQLFYFLTERKEVWSWREKTFFAELQQRGKDDFLRRLIQMEIPAGFGKDTSWRQLSKNWLWGELGDTLRKMHWSGMEHG